jgi:PAS domain S-box-containing protein
MADSPPGQARREGAEARRLAALARYRILDTPREADFDDIAELASEICGTPIALVNLIADGRQWFKAEVGLGVRETPLETSFCGHAILEEDFMLVPDAARDPRFERNPLVTGAPGLRFYAGALLKTDDGFPIGTLCVLDHRPRTLTEQQIRALKRLARQVMSQLEQRRAEAALRESEARFRHMADSAPALIWMTDAEGQVAFANMHYDHMFGRPAAEMLGGGWREVILPEDVDAFDGAFQAAFQARRPFRVEVRVRGKDGEVRWLRCEGVPRLDDGHAFLGYTGCNVDITDAKAAEAELRRLAETLEQRVEARTAELAESERRFRAIFDTTFQLTGLGTLDGTIIVVNRAALEAARATHEQVAGAKMWEAPWWASSPGEVRRVREGVARVAAGEFVRYESELVLPEVGRRVFDFSMKPVLDAAGKPSFLVAEGRDITELKRTEDALRQAQKMEAIGQLTGGVAHDFNNLLTVIRSSADLLRRPDLTDERRRRYVDAIADTVARASKLTGQLLAFARRQALKPEVFDAAGRVEAMADMLRTVMGARIRIAADVGGGPCPVEADASQFETALVNMAVNARDAMDGEGALAMRVREVSAIPQIRGHRGGVGRFVAVSLSDTGSGIPPDKIGQIFEPFFTTKEVGKGTGLGLSQVYGFAKQSGGDVAVESEVGRGTTFTLYLPRAEKGAADDGAPPADTERAASAAENGRGRRVLVVEDNAEVGGFSTQVLQDLGYETAWATNAAEALALLGEGGHRFDAVFSDVVMPGMSGVELAKEIRRRRPGLPVVLTSGYSQVLAEEGRHGFELLHKPYAAEELSRVLRRATARVGRGAG